MNSEWHKSCLGDLVELQRGTTYKSSLLGLPGPFLLGLASIRPNGGFRDSSLRTYGGESADKLILRPGDIYVSLKDVTQSADLLGAVSQVPPQIATGRLTQDTVKLTFKNDNAPSNFIYWLLRTPEYREYCRAHSMGTTNLSLSRVDFLSFAVPEPTAKRLSLVTVLEGIDKRIDLNHQINQTLEQMAQALFQAWFVDFEPVKAKVAARAEGRDPLHAAMCALSGKTDDELDELPREAFDTLAATAALFPEAMEESVLGVIPQGWKVHPLGGVLELAYGKALPKTEHRPGVVPVYGSGGIGGFHDTALVSGPGVVVGRKGTVGSVFWIDSDFCAIDTVFYVKLLRPVPLFWAYEHLRRIDIASLGADSAVPGVNRNSVYMQQIVVPSEELLGHYQNIVQPLVTMLKVQSEQAATLATLRDSLLPKLLSGELAVTPEETPA